MLMPSVFHPRYNRCATVEEAQKVWSHDPRPLPFEHAHPVLYMSEHTTRGMLGEFLAEQAGLSESAVAAHDDLCAVAAAETEDARRDGAVATGEQSQTESDRRFIVADSDSEA